MTTQHIETLIIGAGQAGLATGHRLQRLGRDCLIVDGNVRVGDNWRQHYDSLRLYTPRRYCALPGLAFPGDPWSYPTKDDVAGYLEAYALHADLPIRLRTRVDHLAPRAGGGYTATLGADAIDCDNVVVATGTFGRTPHVPGFATELRPEIRQLHSSEYRRPSQLDDGPVLVVGASHSGCDIAYELAADRPTILVGPDRGQLPIEWDSRLMRLAFPAALPLVRHVVTRRNPIVRRQLGHLRGHGGPMLRVKRHHLAARGVERVEARVRGTSDGRPRLDDGRTLDVATVVWCTGFRQVFDWIDLPIFGDRDWPDEYRGVVESAPGLYFCGLAFQYAFSSMLLPGVGRDAGYVARHIAAAGRPRRRPARRRANGPSTGRRVGSVVAASAGRQGEP